MTDFNFSSEVEEAEDPIALQELFYERGWTDGLPVVPPTPARVAEFLQASGYGPSDMIAFIPTRNRIITAEKVAINCVMAGCLPGYMQVVVAILQPSGHVGTLLHFPCINYLHGWFRSVCRGQWTNPARARDEQWGERVRAG